jgi:hypothetical protein
MDQSKIAVLLSYEKNWRYHRRGKGGKLAKNDIKSAFRLLRVSPSDFDQLGIDISGYQLLRQRENHPNSAKYLYYQSFDAIDMINRIGKGGKLAKTDIKSAFRLLRVSPSDFDQFCSVNQCNAVEHFSKSEQLIEAPNGRHLSK